MTDSVATRQRLLLVLLLFLHTVNTYMDRVCISAAKSSMQGDIAGLDDQMMGYVFGIFAVGYALFQIPAGWFSDRAGPRRALTIVVVVWSVFTALTGAVFTAISLLVVRFLFGVGEAGAYPGATRALYSWLPAKERGIGQGVFHSGARIGAAVSLVLMPAVISWIDWRWTFAANGLVGLVWGVVWWFWYRDRPKDHSWTNQAEVKLIETGIQEQATPQESIPYVQVVTSANVLLAMFGVETTLSPSWSFCMDIGGSRSGAVSGAMNMVGNLGAALSAVLFPYFVANVTLPIFATSTGTANSFFVFAALMNALAVVAWLFMNPLRPLRELSNQAIRLRLAAFVGLILLVVAALIYTKFMMG